VLHKENIASVLVEGGATTLNHFIDSALWDEVCVFTGDTLLSKMGFQLLK
jgi:diaminohydroxyphosphoribosylaminopyrimidine deaminase / 5-amino-6-(5-phosphoribosylamino)uracil reductase